MQKDNSPQQPGQGSSNRDSTSDLFGLGGYDQSWGSSNGAQWGNGGGNQRQSGGQAQEDLNSALANLLGHGSW